MTYEVSATWIGNKHSDDMSKLLETKNFRWLPFSLRLACGIVQSPPLYWFPTRLLSFIPRTSSA
jgi:hypothetical protein